MLWGRYEGNLSSSLESLAGEQIGWEMWHLCQMLFLSQDGHLWLRACPGWPLMLPSNPGLFSVSPSLFSVSWSLEEEEVARDRIFTFDSCRWPITGLTGEQGRQEELQPVISHPFSGSLCDGSLCLALKAEYVPSLSTEMAFCTFVERFNMKYTFNNMVTQRGTEEDKHKKLAIASAISCPLGPFFVKP